METVPGSKEVVVAGCKVTLDFRRTESTQWTVAGTVWCGLGEISCTVFHTGLLSNPRGRTARLEERRRSHRKKYPDRRGGRPRTERTQIACHPHMLCFCTPLSSRRVFSRVSIRTHPHSMSAAPHSFFGRAKPAGMLNHRNRIPDWIHSGTSLASLNSTRQHKGDGSKEIAPFRRRRNGPREMRACTSLAVRHPVASLSAKTFSPAWTDQG